MTGDKEKYSKARGEVKKERRIMLHSASCLSTLLIITYNLFHFSIPSMPCLLIPNFLASLLEKRCGIVIVKCIVISYHKNAAKYRLLRAEARAYNPEPSAIPTNSQLTAIM